MNQSLDTSTAAQKLLVCATSFGFSCLAFVLSLFVLVPLTGWMLNSIRAPELLTQLVICGELFALPVVAAIFGIDVGARVAEAVPSADSAAR